VQAVVRRRAGLDVAVCRLFTVAFDLCPAEWRVACTEQPLYERHDSEFEVPVAKVDFEPHVVHSGRASEVVRCTREPSVFSREGRRIDGEAALTGLLALLYARTCRVAVG